MIIGITGSNASGKGKVCTYIKSKGLIYRSLSDVLREESRRLGIEPLRENLIKLGNELRLKKGNSFLAQCIIKTLKKSEDYIIDSIRNPAEIEGFRKFCDFVLVGIDAPIDIRFKRSVKRKRVGDPRTLQEFIDKEEKENKKNPENQQLKKCLKMADFIIENNSTIKELHRKMDDLLDKIVGKPL